MIRGAFMTDQHFDTSSRWEETLRIAKWCEAKCRELDVDLIALGGDIFERRPNPLEMRAVCEHVQALANIATVVGVRGNHDVEDSLAPMNLLDARYTIHVVDRPHSRQFTAKNREAYNVHLMPWPRRAALLASVGDVGREAAGQVANEALHNVLRGFGMHRTPGVPSIFVGHVQIGGSKVSTGQPLAPGADFELTLADMALAQADAYLLGHIHLPQEWSIGEAPALYGGSTRRTAYGELEEKYLTVVGLEPGQPPAVDRHVVPTTPMVLVEYQDIERWNASRIDWDATLHPAAEIRLRYHTKREKRETARAIALRLRDDFLKAGASVVKLDEVVAPETRTRDVSVSTIVNPEAKLEAFWQARSFDPADRRQPLLDKFREVNQCA